jgi:hypothetical protein
MSNPKRTRKEIREAIKKIKIKTPKYYIGRIFGYEASHIIEDFELSYNIGSVCSYILRAGSKKSKAMSDIDKQIDDYYKAVAHLKMEIDRLNRFKRLRDEI